MPDALEQLARPPIVEVICGFFFRSTPIKDFFALSEYAQAVSPRFPVRSLHFAVSEERGLEFVGDAVPPLRIWCASANESRLIQLQHDRLYVNWRARAETYPRFSDHENQHGLMQDSLTEFRQFSSHCARALGMELRLDAIDLVKVDDFVEGVHWDGFADLGVMLPALRLIDTGRSDSPTIGMEVREDRPDGRLTVSLVSVQAATKQRALRLVCQRLRNVVSEADLRDAFRMANEDVNATFSSLVSKEQRAIRFGRKEPT